jgi:hypothetical protein
MYPPPPTPPLSLASFLVSHFLTIFMPSSLPSRNASFIVLDMGPCTTIDSSSIHVLEALQLELQLLAGNGSAGDPENGAGETSTEGGAAATAAAAVQLVFAGCGYQLLRTMRFAHFQERIGGECFFHPGMCNANAKFHPTLSLTSHLSFVIIDLCPLLGRCAHCSAVCFPSWRGPFRRHRCPRGRWWL